MTIEDLCGTSVEETRAYVLHPLVSEVMTYSFEDAPNYEKLKFILEKVLLERSVVPKK